MKRGATVEERLLTPEEIGEVYQVTGRTVRDWFHAGLIPAEVAVGRVMRFDLEKVKDALAANAERARGMRPREFVEVV
jgi:excisionase family DNA binding protein